MALEREVQEHDYQISAKNTETHSLQVSVTGILVDSEGIILLITRRSSTLSTLR